LLHRQRIAHRFIVMGSGPMLSMLQERCPHALFTGRISSSEVPLVMASADVLLYRGRGRQAAASCSKHKPAACPWLSPALAVPARTCCPAEPGSCAEPATLRSLRCVWACCWSTGSDDARWVRRLAPMRARVLGNGRSRPCAPHIATPAR
jgi:hypothetical protein